MSFNGLLPRVFGLVLAATVSVPALASNVIHVSTAGNDANDGLTWATAKRSVQVGLNAAVAGDQVWVAAGTYVQCITLTAGVALYGGFAGSETDLSQRNWSINRTILDGNQGGNVVTSPAGATQTTHIDGFTIRNGSGCGIYCSSASPAISNNRITGNISVGINCNYSSAGISNNTITGNAGGGINCNYSSPVISNNTITGNGVGWGAIYFYASSAVISNNIVAFNQSGLSNGTGMMPTLRNNCVYNPAGVDYSYLNPGVGDISVDPQLVAPGYGEVHLKASSPCIDAGYDGAVQSGWVDMDGQQRIQGAHVDIGADEFSGTTPSFTLNLVRVSPSGDDANDGATWTSAKRTAQAAIDTAAGSGGGDVWVAAGTYSERITLKPWVHVYGGFAGAENSRDQRDWRVNITILDGSAAGSVVTASAPGFRSSTIDGFTIRNGIGSSGGGVYCRYSSPAISNNRIIGNTAYGSGGGIYCSALSPAISNNVICANGANDTGGGICGAGPSAAIFNNVISGNTARNSGGGIYMDCAASFVFVAISNNTITGNTANSYGGGVYCTSSPMISNNIVAFNSSGLYNLGGTPTLRNNCVYNPAGADYTGLSAGAGDISADPQLVAAEHGEVHLKANSSCIDAGLDDVVQLGWGDMDGQPRIQGAHVDIGADEFNGTTPPFTLKIVRVSPSGNDANDGTTWASAKLTVQAAIDAAARAGSGDVWVAAGTYSERISLKTWVHMYGGFAGTEDSQEQRHWATNVTVLDGNAGGSVVTASSPGYCSSTIDGFTIRNGNSSDGGGIYCQSSSPRICNNVILGNTAADKGAPGAWAHGGGIYCNSSSAVISNNTIAGNTARSGGGIYGVSSSASIVGNAITGNTASGSGGGVYCAACSGAITNNAITGNTAATDGGGIYYPTASFFPAISNNTITGNNAGSAYGGGVCCYTSTGSSAAISNNIVAFNSSGLYCKGTTGLAPTLRNNCVYNPSGVDYRFLLAGTADISVDPLFTNSQVGDYHLAGGSPCIDTGDNASVPAGLTVDLDGSQRIFDGAGDPAAIVDMGAFEFHEIVPRHTLTTAVVGGNGSVAPAGGIYSEGFVVGLTASPAAGYWVSSWAGTDDDSSIAPSNTVTMNADRQVTVTYAPIPIFPGDLDHDGHVNAGDLQILVACGTGPAVPYNSALLPQAPPGCTLVPDADGIIAADFDRDGDVDGEDFAAFQRCWSGNLGADPNCAN